MATKQRSVRLPEDVSNALERVAKKYDLDETDVIKRALRSYIRQVERDEKTLLSKESTEELNATQ